ncbi:DUF6125 family protein [Chloroflexota bacterium]
MELNDKQIAEFWHRSYTTVDGLWFMKVEEKYGFRTALEVDNEVWKVLPKIQARMLKSLAKAGDGIETLFECITTKLELEGFVFDAEKDEDNTNFNVTVKRCPWHDLLVKSGRTELSGDVGSVICNTEYSVWASEFGDNICFDLQGQICKGSESCVLSFSHRNPQT